MRALADTSLFIGRECDRTLRGEPPEHLLVSVITVAELRPGVLTALDLDARARRLRTLHLVESLEPLPVDDSVAAMWAQLVAQLRDAGRKVPINGSWIAATAVAHGLPVATQDADYDGMPGVRVIRL